MDVYFGLLLVLPVVQIPIFHFLLYDGMFLCLCYTVCRLFMSVSADSKSKAKHATTNLNKISALRKRKTARTYGCSSALKAFADLILS